MVARQLWLRISIIAAALIFDAVLSLADLAPNEQSAPAKHIKLNKSAFEHARQLIAEHRFVNDKHGAWRVHRPSAETDSAFVRQHGFDEYARWHLGIDESHGLNSKARYRFPFGDYKNLHRCALIAVQSRARQYRYVEIEKAATDLLKLMAAPSSTNANTPKRHNSQKHIKCDYIAPGLAPFSPAQLLRKASISSGNSSL